MSYVARDHTGKGYAVAARLVNSPNVTTAIVRVAVCTAQDTPRPGLTESFDADQAEIYAYALLTAVARARVLLEINEAHRRDADHAG